MRSVDTNVLARWLLGDEPAQTKVAASILSEPTWISLTVMLELSWVLGKSVGLPRAVTADLLQQVVDLDTVVVEHREFLAWAVGRYREGADWGDVVHIVASSGEADTFVTFDRSLRRKAGDESPIAIETLRT